MEMSPEKLMYELLQAQEELDQVASRLNRDGSKVFAEISIKRPKFEPAELGFIYTVSWLFVLYYEVGKVGVDFLCEKLTAYGITTDGFCERHYILVQQFRTYLQHNLDLTTPRNRKLQEACESWLKEKCGSPIPGTNEQWQLCLVSLLSEAKTFLNSLRDCVRQIERDEAVESVLTEWEFRRKRFHPPHEFDNLISIVAADMGRDKIDPVRFRKRFYEKWAKELDLLDGTYDFAIEGRKLVEQSLLTDLTPVLPITGRDIIEERGLEPGPMIGELLEKARQLFESGVKTKDELLSALKPTESASPEGSAAGRT